MLAAGLREPVQPIFVAQAMRVARARVAERALAGRLSEFDSDELVALS